MMAEHMKRLEDVVFDFLDGPHLFAVLFAAMAMASIAVCVFLVADARADAACLRAGYPSARIDWSLNAYCVKRVDQTDVVVPLSTVRSQ
jgi:hypothetical protein